ncbi:UNVERIFIED_CONTAM: hypothetical protein Sangu_1983500 [Sesamum angustifolium]|uniref:Bifunctional inhibitor/plant lipid transfer protein/seed storage helical domain-containing protein n=1 Tax=Sesamum angustifolium TaxID=2727405 RepID=A0AAW2LWE0_9LAMI
MERSTKFSHLSILCLVIALLTIVAAPVSSQSSASCTGPMIRSFSSCISFLSSGSNASSPTSACCSSLRALMSNGQDCLCLIVTGGVPFQVPINQTLAISLPRACRMSGVPIECKATASPVPAPDAGTPGQGGPLYPGFSPPSPTVPFTPQPFTPPSLGPGGRLTPPLAPEGDLVPTLTPPGMRPTLTPSAAQPSLSALPSLLAAVVFGVILLKWY